MTMIQKLFNRLWGMDSAKAKLFPRRSVKAYTEAEAEAEIRAVPAHYAPTYPFGLNRQTIVCSTQPMGFYEGVIISGTPLPGTCAEIVPAVNPLNGRYTYRNVTRANGAKGPVAVFDADYGQGFTVTTPYVNGAWGRIYWPVAGEELMMVMRESTGTGTTGEGVIGDLLSIENTTGMLIAGTGTSEPFWFIDPTGLPEAANTLKLCKYLGNNA